MGGVGGGRDIIGRVLEGGVRSVVRKVGVSVVGYSIDLANRDKLVVDFAFDILSAIHQLVLFELLNFSFQEYVGLLQVLYLLVRPLVVINDFMKVPQLINHLLVFILHLD